MLIKDKITLKNYKCFNSDGGGFEKIMPINVVIGRNNAGKSSLIDLISALAKGNMNLQKSIKSDFAPEIHIEHSLTDGDIAAVFFPHKSGGGIPGVSHYNYGKTLENGRFRYKIVAGNIKEFVNLDVQHNSAARVILQGLVQKIEIPLFSKEFCHISAERDVIPEMNHNIFSLNPKGVGSTNYVRKILNSVDLDSSLIEDELLRELNEIINPDINFKRLLVQEISDNHWEVFFYDANDNRVALSKMGSGIKTILLVLLNLIVRPIVEKKNKNEYVFAFEELENNLHPALQRRLYEYIKRYSEKHSVYFFITTHSNIVIDSFGVYKNAQLIHVENDGKVSKTTTILSQNKTKQILKDLDVRASDILQSNGIIWVEGPSDRNYINKWLELIDPKLEEGLHYSIMFYGGRLLSNLNFDYEWFNKEIIPLLKINTNAFVVMDRDGKTIGTKLNETKDRISKEIGGENCWITKGREIENYLTDQTIKGWLHKAHGITTDFSNEVNSKLEDNIANTKKAKALKYNLSKTVYSGEIVEYIDKNSIDSLDLRLKLGQLVMKIKDWNSLN